MKIQITGGVLFTSIHKNYYISKCTYTVSSDRFALWLFSLMFSYLLREAMCSSERPPSPSSTMNNLSLSSLGCTGKLLRKMSVKRMEEKTSCFCLPHTHTQTRTHSFINSYLNMHIKHTHTESLPTDKMEIFLPMMKNLQMHLEGKKAPSIITSAYKFYRSTCKLIYITTNLN